MSRSLKSTIRKYEPVIETVEDTLSIFQLDKDEQGNLIVDDRLTMLIGGITKGVAETLKMSILGAISGQVRLDKGLKGAMTQDIVDKQMPILNLIGDILGINTTKYIQKHPEALGQIMKLAAPLIQKFQGQNRNNGPGVPSGNIGVMQ